MGASIIRQIDDTKSVVKCDGFKEECACIGDELVDNSTTWGRTHINEINLTHIKERKHAISNETQKLENVQRAHSTNTTNTSQRAQPLSLKTHGGQAAGVVDELHRIDDREREQVGVGQGVGRGVVKGEESPGGRVRLVFVVAAAGVEAAVAERLKVREQGVHDVRILLVAHVLPLVASAATNLAPAMQCRASIYQMRGLIMTAYIRTCLPSRRLFPLVLEAAAIVRGVAGFGGGAVGSSTEAAAQMEARLRRIRMVQQLLRGQLHHPSVEPVEVLGLARRLALPPGRGGRVVPGGGSPDCACEPGSLDVTMQ